MQDGVNPEIVSALYAKDAGIVSPYKLTIALCDRAILNGAEVRLEENIESIRFDKKFIVKTQNGEYESKYLVNSAGGGASDINALLSDETYETAFRKGEYFVLDKTEGARVKTVLFPLPDENGKGILVAPTADGNVIYGPTSEACEEDDTSCTAQGLDLVRQGVSKVFANPNYRAVIREYAGVRAVVGEDFIVKRSEKYHDFFILAGICSPGLTSAPSIGKYIADEIEKEYKVEKPENPVKVLHHDRLKNLTAEELNEKVKNNPKWGRIICRCETVTEAEIVNAIHSPLPATTVDAVKRRVRAGMGRCQGGFCAPRVIDILSRELGIPVTKVKKGGKGSELVKCRIKEDN
ncbi:MAG: FAD-dependent oxidoreductase [Clostridiales bacterium]|nr:MAG: FAD-dependent oxidoreductase [Clostridiales bacterium]